MSANTGSIKDVLLEAGGVIMHMCLAKLLIYHFDKNTHSRVNVTLTTQILSSSAHDMIRNDTNINLKKTSSLGQYLRELE